MIPLKGTHHISDFGARAWPLDQGCPQRVISRSNETLEGAWNSDSVKSALREVEGVPDLLQLFYNNASLTSVDITLFNYDHKFLGILVTMSLKPA